ncbi:MAG: Coenzyme F420 hydrogenase/dehydrogenase, beta subunit C-terminal domain [Acidobacteria bacterium]|nr:Coenzyme F420 hydrogenase/dehydrogenase, beta subunit C-terminal domain [Acidobacteriota bacterium]
MSEAGGFEKLRREVIDTGLCTRCGSCVGVCPPGAIEFREPLGVSLPAIRDSAACEGCPGHCYTGCSGGAVHFPTLAAFTHGRQPANPYLGVFQSLYVGHANDEHVRRAGASGGIISATAIYMLEHDMVDGVVALGANREEPWRFEPRIARSRAEVLECAQSKYSISPANVILRELDKEAPGFRAAFIGIPCQVHAIRKLQADGHPAARKIRYVIGSYCGNILHFDAVRGFLAKHGVADYTAISRLEYRAGEWPGKMRVTLVDGRVLEMPKFYANYLIPFYMMRRCLTCTDLANEFSDISGGDAWAPVYEERGKGFSLIMGRTDRGQRVIEEMIRKGRLTVEPVEEGFTVNMHSHMLDFKKRGAFLRIDAMRARGKAVPSYGFRPVTPAPFGRRAFEVLLRLIYGVCSLRLSQWTVAQLPTGLTGRLFEQARRRWKGVTKSTKRKGFSEIEFTFEPPRQTVYQLPAEELGEQSAALAERAE